MSGKYEMLDRIAKAAGMRIEWRAPTNAPEARNAFDLDAQRLWKPEDDDGDALRLAARFGLKVDMDFKTSPGDGPGIGSGFRATAHFTPASGLRTQPINARQLGKQYCAPPCK